MKPEHNGLGPSSSEAVAQNLVPSTTSRDPYSTPRLTSYGRFQHITGSSGGNSQGENDEGVIDSGSTDF